MTYETEHAACSWCGTLTHHELVEKNYLRRNIYRCVGCGEKTVQCRYCKHMAKTGEKWDDELCAEHDGSIASFERLNLKIDDLADFKKLFERDSTNLLRIGKIAAGTVAGVTVFAPLAVLAAPAAASALGAVGLLGAAGTGTAISTLSGAALTSASLAAIGGGTMMGGVVIVTAAGAALGAYQGGMISNSYFGTVDHFGIHKVNHGRKSNKHAVIFVNGFLSQDNRDVEDWTQHLGDYFDEDAWYHVDWESQNLQKLGMMVSKTPQKAGLEMAKELGKRAAKEGAKKIGPFSMASNIADVIGNPWHSAMVKASMTGVLLADAIARTSGWTFTLAGHSLGARAIYYALEALSTRTKGAVIDDVYLLGGAVGGGEKDVEGWEIATKAVKGKIYNCFSEQDHVLKYLYQGANAWMSAPIGYHGIDLRHRKIENLDCSELVGGHTLWKKEFGSILAHVKG
ncbi:DUF726 domain-containing protein [Burkholderia sp. Bp8963]|uniref:DUF726 domain-containing protein n=1 Tax=Burkholderia sp. Bp8963 TaxID=2184547 RepID=UPI000F591346|nr:DUF726 domain-containing protein [Burkholderia sp. Bp8963]RQS60664.1 DUF726 domain-containing protein [Burkholderia sp. Bp8963]